MYTLEQLQHKNIKQLKEIGWQLNVLPEGDRRCRQNWIDAIVGVNPPLLQLLEVSSAASAVEQVQPIIETLETPSAVEVEPVQTLPIESKFGRIVYPRLTQKSIAQAVENFPGVDPGVEVDRAQEPIAQVGLYSPGVDVDYIESQLQEPLLEASPGACDCPFCGAQHGLFIDRDHMDRFVIRCLHCGNSKLKTYPGAIRTLAQESVLLLSKSGGTFCKLAAKPIETQRQEPIQNTLGAKVDQRQEPIAPAAEKFSGFERVTDFNRNNFSGFERVTDFNRNNFSGFERVQEPIVPAAKNFPGSRSKASTAHQLLELFNSRVHVVEDSPGVKTEVRVSESAIAPFSAKNPILTGLTFSDRFLARYSPPQPEIIHFRSDADGQLSLLDFEIESVDEPPDPDDFESLDAFREALACWDCEHNEVSPEHNEPLQVSLDSFSLWAHCPVDWYEPAALLEPSSMLELSQTRKSSITSDFFIPTFDCLSDRSNKSDEPPDTGVFAKLPKPKPPRFPPVTFGQVQPKLQPTVTQPQAKRIPNAYQTHTSCILAGSSTQPARSPPGGDVSV